MQLRPEKTIAEYFNRMYCILFGSGTTALYAIFKALQLPPGTKVLYPDITCETALNAALYAGLSPIFCDIDKNNFNLDTDKALQLCKDNTVKVIVPTHIFGHLYDLSLLRKKLQNKNIFILEDAAQAFGGELSGVKAGKMGDAAIISFGYGKTIDCGGGGAVLTDSEDLFEKCLAVEKTLSGGNSTRTVMRDAYMKEMFILNKNSKGKNDYIKNRDALKIKYMKMHLLKIDNSLLSKISKSLCNIDKTLKSHKSKSDCINDFLAGNKNIFIPTQTGTPIKWRFSFLVNNYRDEIYNQLLRNRVSISKLFSPLHTGYNLPDNNYTNALDFYSKIINIKLDFDEVDLPKIARVISTAVNANC